MRKSIQGQVKNVKKGQIFKIYLLENKDMFLKQNLLSNPMVPLVFLYVGYNCQKIAFKCMTSLFGTMGKTKTSLLRVKNYRVELKLCTLVEDR